MDNVKKLLRGMEYEIIPLKKGFKIAKDNLQFANVQNNGIIKFKFPNEEHLKFLRDILFQECSGAGMDKEGRCVLTEEQIMNLFENPLFGVFLEGALWIKSMEETKDLIELKINNKIYLVRHIDNGHGGNLEERTIKESTGGGYERAGCYFDKKQKWLDFGSHLGSFSITYFDKVDFIDCYDIGKAICEIHIKSLAKNKANNVTVRNMAVVGNNDKKRPFFFGRSSSASGQKATSSKKKVDINCVNVNAILNHYRKVNIKMDIEGTEYEVIKAITKKNWDKVEQIVFEFHFLALNDVGIGKKWKEIMKIIKQNFKTVNAIKDIKNNWNTVVYAKK